MYEHECLNCGKKFETSSSLTRFCSKECMEARREKLKEERAKEKQARLDTRERLNRKELEARRLGVSYGMLQVLAARKLAEEARNNAKRERPRRKSHAS